MTIKRLAIAFAILILPTCLMAQKGTSFAIRLSPIFYASTDLEDPLSIGVGIPNIKNINEFGFGGGLDIYFGLGKAFLIKTGVGMAATKFTNELSTTDNQGNTVIIETESRFGTIEVPLGLRLRLPVSEFTPAPFVGADIVAVHAFNFKEGINNALGNDPGTNMNNFNANSIIFAFAPSAGIDIPIGVVKLEFGLRYHMNLSALERDDTGQTAKVNYLAADVKFVF